MYRCGEAGGPVGEGGRAGLAERLCTERRAGRWAKTGRRGEGRAGQCGQGGRPVPPCCPPAAVYYVLLHSTMFYCMFAHTSTTFYCVLLCSATCLARGMSKRVVEHSKTQ